MPFSAPHAVKTRERIIEASLALFNELGEPNVTTNHIADEMDISPGNLYYHFRSKDDIINTLFDRFEQEMNAILVAPRDRVPTMEDLWFYLHLVFEIIARYRFLYRDLNNLVDRNARVRRGFQRILARGAATARAICRGLVNAGALNATTAEVEALATQVSIITTYWLNFERIHKPASGADPLALGVYHVMVLVAPYLRAEERQSLNALAATYLR